MAVLVVDIALGVLGFGGLLLLALLLWRRVSALKAEVSSATSRLTAARGVLDLGSVGPTAARSRKPARPNR